MIILLTTPEHQYTLRSIAEGQFGVPVPDIRSLTYDQVFAASTLPRATYVFADLERLSTSRLRRAADLYRKLRDLGVRCLNDPACAMSRVELLTNLSEKTGNPIEVNRADMCPRPSRFPVFLRLEDEHEMPSDALYYSQGELDEALAAQRRDGVPLRGLLVLEKVDATYNGTLWAKWGSWRIGDRIVVEHIAVEDRWMVKYGRHDCLTEDIVSDEFDAVSTNRFEPLLKPAFETAGIEYGRADHAATPDGAVVFEINTNPFLGNYVPDPWLKRRDTQMLARQRWSEAMQAIDTPC
ncbi:hypothetical protein [Azospirillum sp. TSA6c]|uniref:hypothetical protein n=1 Tax=unclassified Azospirillum TaxID=2630922 RepID=UPI000D658E15|nr:hypothetical protein [Azospirillum sp. TSA6c]